MHWTLQAAFWYGEGPPSAAIASERVGNLAFQALPRPASDHRLVITLGLHSSASTWLYNIAREAMVAAHGSEAVVALYMDSIKQLFETRNIPGRRVVIKTHGIPELPTLLHLAGATMLVTIRDPRDAAVSIIERFGGSWEVAVNGLARDCNYAVAGAAAGYPVLRYEDRFFDRPEAVGEIARFIGAPIPPAEAERIFAAYRTDAVRDFARALPALPADRVSGDTPETRLDQVTQIHETHIGDGRIGKWRERLDAAEQAKVTQLFAPFLKAFRYTTPPDPSAPQPSPPAA